MPTKLYFSALLLAISFNTLAQPGIKDSIYSAVIGEERALQIQLPKEYKPGSGDKYQVLYLLDGEWNAELFEQTQAWSRQWGFTMPIIMVGVKNSYPNNQNQRFRDLTPTKVEENGSGGGPKLLSFLKDELIPYINKTYPANGSNILWGHSLGGLFVLYALFTEPQLFDSYIAADPSCWWDHGFLKGYAREKIKDVKGVKSLFITGRTGEAYHDMGIDSFLMVLKEIAPPTLLWKDVAYPDETHISQQGKSAYDGLKYTLTPSMIDRIHMDPMGGIVEKGKPFSLVCQNQLAEKNIRYSTDGKEPTLASAKMHEANMITPVSDVRLKVKAFFTNDTLDKTFATTYKLGSPLRAKKKPAGAIQGGWNYACFRTADGTSLIKSGTTAEHVDLNNVDSNGVFYTLSGYLETTKKGYYMFEMAGEQGAKLFLGGAPLMEIPAGKDYNSYLVPLEAGFYDIRFEYTHSKGGSNFYFGYRRPDVAGDGPFLPGVMYH